ncbi:fibroin heavy chain [Colletotrichum higginsianum]|nr:fibroin heavy chain [Colletotrichum higginsianum]
MARKTSLSVVGLTLWCSIPRTSLFSSSMTMSRPMALSSRLLPSARESPSPLSLPSTSDAETEKRIWPWYVSASTRADGNAPTTHRRILSISASVECGAVRLTRCTYSESPNRLRSSPTSPTASMRCATMPARPASASASSMLCVVRRIDRPGTMPARVRHMTRFAAASRPDDGSSRSITDGLPRDAEGQLAPVAARQVLRRHVDVGVEADGADHGAHLVLGVRDAPEPGVVAEVLGDRHGVDGVELRTHAEVGAGEGPLGRDGDLLDQDVAAAAAAGGAAARLDVAADEGDGRRLAGAVGAEEGKDLAVADAEGDVVDGGEGPELLCDVPDLEAVVVGDGIDVHTLAGHLGVLFVPAVIIQEDAEEKDGLDGEVENRPAVRVQGAGVAEPRPGARQREGVQADEQGPADGRDGEDGRDGVVADEDVAVGNGGGGEGDDVEEGDQVDGEPDAVVGHDGGKGGDLAAGEERQDVGEQDGGDAVEEEDGEEVARGEPDVRGRGEDDGREQQGREEDAKVEEEVGRPQRQRADAARVLQAADLGPPLDVGVQPEEGRDDGQGDAEVDGQLGRGQRRARDDAVEGGVGGGDADVCRRDAQQVLQDDGGEDGVGVRPVGDGRRSVRPAAGPEAAGGDVPPVVLDEPAEVLVAVTQRDVVAGGVGGTVGPGGRQEAQEISHRGAGEGGRGPGGYRCPLEGFSVVVQVPRSAGEVGRVAARGPLVGDEQLHDGGRDDGDDEDDGVRDPVRLE